MSGPQAWAGTSAEIDTQMRLSHWLNTRPDRLQQRSFPNSFPVEIPSSQSSDGTTSHSTSLAKDASQVAGYPASGRGSEQERLSSMPVGERGNELLRDVYVEEMDVETPYLPGLVWMVPEEAQVQLRIKHQLLEQIQSARIASGVNRIDAGNLAEFVASFPATGRVVVDKTDPRWLEVNPQHDPILKNGQRIVIPARPTTVTVVRGDGHTCQVAHSVNFYAPDYVRRCDATGSPQLAWVVQPDGL
ncbi:MAG: hypothetical protein Q8J90_11300, partial [Gallionella sp.]|nr:hypothetical protein [Gallionella sp.]